MKNHNLQDFSSHKYSKEIVHNNFKSKAKNQLSVHKIKNKDIIFKEAKKLLLENIEKRITIYALCRKIGTNPNTISKLFNERLKQSPFAWLKKERLELSARLLETTEYKVYQIAHEVGYPDPNNFSTAFKKHFGTSPAKYKKSNSSVAIISQT